VIQSLQYFTVMIVSLCWWKVTYKLYLDLFCLDIFSNFRAKVTQKLFAIKKIFYLSYSIKLHFFKTFILPHFDYCSSLFIYFSNTLLENIKWLYKNCLFHLLDLDFRGKPKNEQYAILKPLNLLPYKYRILFRFSTFCFKILNKIILKDFFSDLKLNLNVKNTRCKTRNIINVPRS
jgi:hypothetical protein